MVTRKRFFWSLIALILVFSFAQEIKAQESVSLYQAIPTQGARAMHSFQISNEIYLAVANGYDSSRNSNDVYSKIYKWNGASFVEIQSILTHGGQSFATFLIGGDYYLAIANHNSTYIFALDSKIYKWNGAQFVEFQNIPTIGATDVKSFNINGVNYIAFANAGSPFHGRIQNSKIYRWDGIRFIEYQSILTTGGADMEVFNIAGNTYLAIANTWDGYTGNVLSRLYKWNGSLFAEYQSFATSMAADWEFFTIGEEYYLALANNGINNVTYDVDSKIFKWNGNYFVPFQSIPTRGARDWKYFSISGQSYLIVANHETYGLGWNLDSKVYKWNGGSFVEILSIPTNGAVDWESFVIDSQTYLAVANYFDNSSYNIT